jgi:hypothetical protein
MGISELIREWLKEHQTAAGLGERLKLEQERRELEKVRYEQQIQELQNKYDSLLQLLNDANNKLGTEQEQNQNLKEHQRLQEEQTRVLQQELDDLKRHIHAKPLKRDGSWKTV